MTDPPETNDADKRRTTRRRVLFTGKLVYGRPEMTQDCAISDMSKTGARVRLKGPEPLIDPIYLISVHHALAFHARQAWRRGNVAGLAFIRYYDLHGDTQGLPSLVKRIWLEQIR